MYPPFIKNPLIAHLFEQRHKSFLLKQPLQGGINYLIDWRLKISKAELMSVNKCVLLIFWGSLHTACHNITLNFQISCCLLWQKIDSERRGKTIKDKKCLDEKTICSKMLHISPVSFPFYSGSVTSDWWNTMWWCAEFWLGCLGWWQWLANGVDSSNGNKGDPDASCCIFSCLKLCRLLTIKVEVFHAVFLLLDDLFLLLSFT